MAIKYVKEAFLSSDGDGVYVLDVNLQGAWEFGDHRLMQMAFPKTHAYYQAICRKPLTFPPGKVIFCEEHGFKIALLITKKNRKDCNLVAIKNFEKALAEMLHLLPSDVWIYSPILGRQDKLMGTYATIINKNINKDKRYWQVFTKKGI